MSTTRRALAYALTVGASFALSVPAAEGVFRLAGVEPADQTAAVFRPFGSGSYRVRPLVRSSEDWASGPFAIHSDELGLRCGPDGSPRIRPGDTIDTLVLGDSQAFGLGVDYDESVVGVMSAAAAKDGRVVGNAAVGGHFFRNQMELSRALHDEQHLKFGRIVVLLSTDRIAIPDGYSTANVDENGRLYGDAPDAGARVREWVRTHLAAYVVLRGAYHNRLASHERSADASVEVYRASKLPMMVEGWRREFGAAAEWARSVGSRLVIVLLCDAFDTDVDEMAATRGGEWAGMSSETPRNVLRRVCGELGLPLVDVREVLDGRKARGRPLHLGTDFHYDQETSREVGSFIWQALKTDEPRRGK